VIKARGIQYDVVAALANNLVGQGFKPEEISAGAIREETGTGSLSTIMAHLKRWRGQAQPATPELALTSDKMAGVTVAVTALVKDASEKVRDEARKVNAAAEIESARLRTEFEEALALNEQIEDEREAALAEASALQEKVQEVRRREAYLQGQLEALRATLPRLDHASAPPAPVVRQTLPAMALPEQPTIGTTEAEQKIGSGCAEEAGVANVAARSPYPPIRSNEGETTVRQS